MLTKKLVLTALGVAASAPVFAHPDFANRGWHEHRHYVRYYSAPVIVRPYYRPVPVVPRPAPTFSIRLDLPL